MGQIIPLEIGKSVWGQQNKMHWCITVAVPLELHLSIN